MDRIGRRITENFSLFANLALILVALLIARGLYNGQIQYIRNLQKNNQAQLRRNELITRIGALQTKIHSYKEIFGQKDISQIIRFVSDLAKSAKIEIISINPLPVNRHKVYTKLGLNLAIKSKHYRQIKDFLTKLETSKEGFVIKAAEIRPWQQQELGQFMAPTSTYSGIIQADLTLSVLVFEG
jgi:predicted patatin/cPLA2 family phospholipase